MRHPLERERERHDAAPVAGRLVGLDLGGLRMSLVTGPLHRMLGRVVAVRRPTAGSAEGEHPRVLSRAVVVDLLRRPALLEAELEIVLGRLGARKQRAHGGHLLGRVAM